MLRFTLFMTEAFPFKDGDIDQLLIDVLNGNQAKVIGWIKGEQGAWGFLAGQAVISVRGHVGRDLANAERRLVWSRMWSLLEQVKARIVSGL